MTLANPYLHGESPEQAQQNRLKRAAAISSLSVAALLAGVKLYAYIVSDSVSILSSLMDSTFDVVASLVTIISVAHAATPADEDHRYGHGKIEALTALGQSVFVFGFGFFLLFESVHRVFDPVPVKSSGVAMGVTVLAMVLTAGLNAFQSYVIRRTHSVAISADQLHYQGDLFLNAAVLAALVLGRFFPWPYFDPLFAGVIALVLLRGAGGIGWRSFDILMDREIGDAERARIQDIVRAHPAVRAMHDLRTRSSGTQIFIEFHMELDGDMTLEAAHQVTEDVEQALYDAFPKSEVIIHQEPAGLTDDRHDHRIEGAR